MKFQSSFHFFGGYEFGNQFCLLPNALVWRKKNSGTIEQVFDDVLGFKKNWLLSEIYSIFF